MAAFGAGAAFRTAWARLESAFHDLPWPGIENGRRSVLVAWCALTVIAAVTAFAVGTHHEPLVLGAAIAILVGLVSLRAPEVPLFLLVALIPVETALVISDSIGTASRYVAIAFVGAYAARTRRSMQWRVMPVAGWLFLAWGLVSVGWAVEPTATVAEAPVLVLLFATAWCVADLVAKRRSLAVPLLAMYALGACAASVVAIASFFSGSGPEIRAVAVNDQNPGYFAAVILPAFAVGIVGFLSGRHVALGGAATALTGLAIILSGSRASWLAIAVVAAVVVLPRLPLVRRALAVALMSAVAMLALQVPTIGTFVADRTETALATGGAGRTDIWSVALTIYRSAPLTGVGLQNFAPAFTPERVRDSDVSLTFYDPYDPGRAQYRAPHNLILQVLAELGPFGIATLAAFVLPLVWRARRGIDGWMVQAALGGLLVNALFLDLLNRRQLWLFLGLAGGLAAASAGHRIAARGAADERARAGS